MGWSNHPPGATSAPRRSSDSAAAGRAYANGDPTPAIAPAVVVQRRKSRRERSGIQAILNAGGCFRLHNTMLPKPPFACELSNEDELAMFDNLRPRLNGVWDALTDCDERTYTSVVIPSMTLDQRELK